MAAMNCTSLAERNDFSAYASKLLKFTHDDLHLLRPCAREVCTALWGAENSDVSGIGMIIGYVLDQILGLLLGMSVMAMSSSRHPALHGIMTRGLITFHDCASFIAFSGGVASIVLLVEVDLGVSTDGMSNYTVQIVYAVAMLVLLPLVYGILALPSADTTPEESTEKRDGADGSRSKRLTLFVLCWALAFYPFFSAVNAAFGLTKISSRKNAVLSVDQFRIIESICFQKSRPTSDAEAYLMISFIILTYIPLSVVLIGGVLWSGIKANHEHSGVYLSLKRIQNGISSRTRRCGTILCLAALPSLAAGLLWSVFRTRQAQQELARSLKVEDGDNSWTFGQVAAVTLFTPVVFACWSGFASHRKRHGQHSDEQMPSAGAKPSQQ